MPLHIDAALVVEGDAFITQQVFHDLRPAELRVKETDRIDAMVQNLRALGADVEEFDDGLAINGGAPLTGTTVDNFDDHRIAMAMGVAALVASGETTITNAECASVSFPGFWEMLERLREG